MTTLVYSPEEQEVSRRSKVKLGRFSEQTEKRIDVLLKSLSGETAKKKKTKDIIIYTQLKTSAL